MGEFNDNLWAPWRAKYILELSDKPDEKNTDGCFFCNYVATPDQDVDNYVLWRGPGCITVFNSFPYINGHLLIAPQAHVATLDKLDDNVLNELMRTIRDSQNLLSAAMSPHGFNVGMNFGRCAGAGLPGHLHVHVVPRWDGDTNFMSVLSDTRVISESMDTLYHKLSETAREKGLPPLRG